MYTELLVLPQMTTHQKMEEVDFQNRRCVLFARDRKQNWDLRLFQDIKKKNVTHKRKQKNLCNVQMC